jgi:hypothetical protein
VSISNGQQTTRTAGHYLGGHEGATNRSGAPVIDQCQKFYGVGPGVPWCACFVGYVIDQSDADSKYKAAAKSICHPSTQVMADRAKAKGWLLPGNGQAKPGDMFIIPGRHVGFVNSVPDAKTFWTIEGNHQDSVAACLRAWSDGWLRISLPGVGDPGAAATVDGYGFDDTRVKLYGGWATKEGRDDVLQRYAANNPDQWTQAVRVQRDSPFAFRAGPKGTYQHWQFGPWLHKTGKEIRDKQMADYEKANKITARPWKQTYKEA